MEQKKRQKQNQEQLSFSEQLRQSIMNQPCDLAALWGRAADSFTQNKRKQRIRTTIAVVVGVIIGALVIHFSSSPERWIRL
jgi:fatty acid desaturase